MPETQVLIINYNNGNDTIACISSVLSFPDIGILLLDNASADDSPIVIDRYLSAQVPDYKMVTIPELDALGAISSRVLFVRSGANLGFAGGNNVLLRYAIKCTDAKYAWLLNNDAIADKNALPAMIRKMKSQERLAFVGSVILDFARKDLIQCCGVKYYKYFGVSKLILKNQPWEYIDKKKLQELPIDFQHGASLLVRLSAIETVGLMDERFFLYFEEHDWQWTALEKGFTNVLAEDSIVYHKGSVSTNNKKHLFFYYYNQSAIIFARKHSSLPVIISATIMLIGITIVRSQFYFKSILWGIKGLIAGFLKK